MEIVIFGAFLMISGQGIFLRARSENKFFTTVVRIQTERGHSVCSSGPYRVIRHPGYLGMVLSTAGVPLVLDSIWSAVPSCVSVILLVVRTSLEDRTLQTSLGGYPEYAAKIRYKLLPGVW